MPTLRAIGILPGYRPSFIDHLVPLCQLLEIPLLVTEPWIQHLIELFYPPMQIILAQTPDYCLDDYLRGYECFVYVDHYRRVHGGFQFAEYFTTYTARGLYSMHGNSDKNRHIYWIERLQDEDIILLYGQQSIDFMHGKGVKKNHLICGNYRLVHYLMHKPFFDGKVDLTKDKKTILYAPTWSSPNLKSELRFDYTTFFEAHRTIFEKVPAHFHLVVKIHPHHLHLMHDEIKEIENDYPHITFIEDLPLIYPLLNQIDIYLGDYSSIGYDFLYFNKPMFFLNKDEKSSYLHQCGVSITPGLYAQLYDLMQKKEEREFCTVQRQVYSYAFAPLDVQQLKREIKLACASIF